MLPTHVCDYVSPAQDSHQPEHENVRVCCGQTLVLHREVGINDSEPNARCNPDQRHDRSCSGSCNTQAGIQLEDDREADMRTPRKHRHRPCNNFRSSFLNGRLKGNVILLRLNKFRRALLSSTENINCRRATAAIRYVRSYGSCVSPCRPRVNILADLSKAEA